MKVVICGSVKVLPEIKVWVDYWNNQPDCSVINYPQSIEQNNFLEIYPEVHANFFKSITEADILFIANEKKDDVDGYIGPAVFSELSFGLAQKLVYGKNIKLILAHMPDPKVASYDEIVLWLKLGWIDRIMD